MADLIRMHGLVAADIRHGATPGAEAAGRARAAVSGEAQPPAQPAAALELGPARDVAPEALAAAVRARQENITAYDARATALENMRGLLAGARDGHPASLAELRQRAGELGQRLQPGPELARLLAGVEPGAAAAVNPGVVQAAAVETAAGAAAARDRASAERRGLSADLVQAENSAAARTEAVHVDRAAEVLRREAPAGGSGPADLVAALRDTNVSRARALELLTGGGR